MQSIYKKLLAGLGVVSSANTVEEACEMFASSPYKLIITDFLFARGSGLDLIQHVRENFNAMQTPIIMVSASMDPCVRQDAMNAGANYCMTKPPDFKLLVETASQMLTAPFIDATSVEGVYYTAINWSQGGVTYYFCPEFQLLAHAENAASAVSQLEDLIQAELDKGVALKRISVPSVNRCLLKPAAILG
jgi:CheY-like chemotaxis protein